jgi:hypothetical protein
MEGDSEGGGRFVGDEPIAGHTRHGDLTLDQIADLQPGLGRLMLEVSERYWILWHAARGGNWGLAAYELRNLRKTLLAGGVTRPKYAGDLAAYDAGPMDTLARALKTRDWAVFEAAYEEATREANRYHEIRGFPYLVWQLPPDPPGHLKIFPNDQVEKTKAGD